MSNVIKLKKHPIPPMQRIEFEAVHLSQMARIYQIITNDGKPCREDGKLCAINMMLESVERIGKLLNEVLDSEGVEL